MLVLFISPPVRNADPNNEEVPDIVTGEGWVSGVLEDDIMEGVDFDKDGVDEHEEEDQEDGGATCSCVRVYLSLVCMGVSVYMSVCLIINKYFSW